MVFYPRYFEMLNGAIEDWFAHLGWDFRKMHVDLGIGVPTVKLECEFYMPSELCDLLTISVTPIRIGNASCTVSLSVSGDGEERLRATVVLVCMDVAVRKAKPWPPDLRARLVGMQSDK